MPVWRDVPTTQEDRLEAALTSISKLIAERGPEGPKIIMESLGLDFVEMNKHAAHAIEDLYDTLAELIASGGPIKQVLISVYMLGLLTGITYANGEDHDTEDK